ncbi:MAG TPA: PDZ domain-containing protein, partial [Woeseiaceae bacterium]|nr:PDZ domain-containing protein [Woeseiaceae bacterium]
DKSRWQAAPVTAPLLITLQIFAYDLSVRGAHLDTTHAYFNGSCVFPCVAGRDARPCELDIRPPPAPHGKGWRVATSLKPLDAGRYDYGRYRAADYAELIDHPVEIGELQIGEFEAGGIPHAIAIRGHPRVDMARLCKDLSTLCGRHLSFLGPPADLDRYLFLLHVVNDGYGGLEHRWSSSLVCSRGDLPKRGDGAVGNGYRKFLGLCSHEYFHLWNVKRMKPAAFIPCDLQAECYTGLLWVFEGITSYYDDLGLLRAGLITEDSYLELLGQTITRVQRTRGRLRQTVEESSFDAWTKFYKQDANASNAIVSYYAKGALIALALDLDLRHGTDDRVSLDDVMRECWRRWGESGEGMPERGLEAVAAELSGMELGDFFARYVRGTADLPLAQLLRDAGIELHWRASDGRNDAGGKASANADKPLCPWLGARLAAAPGGHFFGVVHSGSPAEKAGIAPGDEAVALNGVRLNTDTFDAQLREYTAGDRVTVTVFRRDELLTFKVTLAKPPEDTAWLTAVADGSAQQAARRKAWLTGSPP